MHTTRTRAILERLRFWIPILMGIGVFLQSLQYGFVYDDQLQIVENTRLESWKHLPGYFTGQVWAFMYADWAGDYYRPLFLVWLRLNYWVFEIVTWGWHLGNIVLHAVAVGTVFMFVRRATADQGVAFWAAAIFAVHPIHVESVTWVSGSPEMLFTIPALISLTLWLRVRDSGGRAAYAASLLFLFLALLSKETAAVLPGVIAMWSFYENREPGFVPRVLRAAWEALPYAAVVAIYLAMRHFALGGFANPQVDHPLGWVLLSIPGAIWFYLSKMAWPVSLSVFYDQPWVTSANAAFWIPLALSLAVLVVLFLLCRRSRVAVLAVPIILLPLVPPVMGIFIWGDEEIVHDRYLYLPVLGFAMLLAYAVRRLTEQPVARLAGNAFLAVVVGLLSLSTVVHNPHWRSDDTLWARAVEMAPNNIKVLNFRGVQLVRDGRRDEGFALLQATVAKRPLEWRTHYNLGVLYFVASDYPNTEKHMSIAVRIFPGTGAVKNALQWHYLGMAAMKNKNYAVAEHAIQQAMAIRPNQRDYHFALAYTYEQQGKLVEARAQYVRALECEPGHPPSLRGVRLIDEKLNPHQADRAAR